MFTVCPKCALTLVVTAADLRVAQGYVRCGRCSSVFNALAQLSDDRTATPAVEGEASPPEAEADEAQSAALAAADEESGESAAAAAADEQPARSASRATAKDESESEQSTAATADDESVPEYTLEFNPETTDAASLFVVAAPSPEWTAATGSFKELTLEQAPATAAPEPRAQDSDEDFEVELDAALLSDIVQSELVAEKPAPTRSPPAPAAPPAESAAAPATARQAGHNRPEAPAAAARAATVESPPAPAAAGSPARTAAGAPGRTPPATAAATTAAAAGGTPSAAAARTPAPAARTPSVTAAATAAATRPSASPAARSPAATTATTTAPAPGSGTPPSTAAATAAATAPRTPPAAPAAAAAVAAASAARTSPAAEVPRGDGAPDPGATAPPSDVAFADFEAVAGASERRPVRPQWQWAAGSVALMLILFAQIINHQRDALATDPRFGSPLTALYSALGVQLTPRWDLRAYDVRQLGATVEAGSTGAITVRASIRNAGTRPQPLPLLRVTLQDRFGNRLASRDVQPSDYVPNGTPPAALLAKDQRIDAELAFVDPGASAVGFELDACLPLGGGIICANDTSAR